LWPLPFTSRRVAGLGRPSPAAGNAHSRAALGDDASMTPASRAARQRSLIRHQFRDLNIARRLCAMTFGIGNHSRSPSCFNLNAGMGTFRLSVRRPGDRLTARWISDRSRGRGSDMNRSVLGVPGVDPHQESLRYPARFCRKPWCRLRYGAWRLSAASRMDRLDDRGSVHSLQAPLRGDLQTRLSDACSPEQKARRDFQLDGAYQ
jgi:hypothetical protein